VRIDSAGAAPFLAGGLTAFKPLSASLMSNQLEGSRMTSDSLQPKPFPDLKAAEASTSHASSADASSADALSADALSADAAVPGALLRALLAGAIALLVLLLPGQLAAARGGDDGRLGCGSGACAIGDRAALDDLSRRHRIGALEITRRDAC
jgi:hypothetical protein